VLSVAYRPIRQGRRVAYLTVASFLFLVLALAMGFFLKTQHGPRREGPAGEGTVGQAHQSCSSTKSECRNPSQIRISKSEGAKLWGFGPFGPADLCSRFEFRVCFVFRASDFGFAARGGGS
jgi:hypothetical protein